MKKENLKEYLRRILHVQIGDFEYVDMETPIKEYKKFIKTLNYEKMDPLVEPLYVYFHRNGLTVSNIVNKGRGKEYLKTKMMEIYSYQKWFYKNVLEPIYVDIAQHTNHSISDFQVELHDRKRINSILPAEGKKAWYSCDYFLQDFIDMWSEFVEYLYKIIDLVFGEHYDAPFLRINEFTKVIDEELTYYYEKKKLYLENLENDREGIYYHGKNDNPLKNLYIHYRNSFIKYFYKPDLPIMEKDKFYELNRFNISFVKKSSYSLSDITDIYIEMTNSKVNRKKVYNNIKTQFRKSPLMSKYKNSRGVYEFNDISIPIAHYVYYRRKNHNIPVPNQWEYDTKVVHIYAPILRTLIHGKEEKINAYNSFRKFLDIEYKDIFSRVDDGYQDAMIDNLLQSTLHIFYRTCGLDVNNIIDFAR